MRKKVLSTVYKIAYFLVFGALHVIAIGVLFYTFWPIAEWYFASRPFWGVDFFLSINIASLINQNPTFPFAVWNYAGFGGWPQFLYPMLLAYFISFLSNFYDLVLSAQISVMISSFLFILGSYFLFYIISRNIILSLALAVFVGLSGGVYQVLTWAGSLPSYASQFAFPWVLGFFVWYLRSGRARFLLVSSLVAGISIWIHPLVYAVYILPAIFLLTIFSFKEDYGILKKIKTFIIFLSISLIIGLPQFYLSINSFLKSAVKTNYGKDALSTARSTPTQFEQDIANFNKAQVPRIVTDNHIAPFYILAVCLALFIVSLVFTLRFGGIVYVFPFGILAGYFTFYIWLFGEGISIYHGGWYRLFWSVPVWVGALASALWFSSYETVKKRVKNYVLRLTFVVVSSALILILAYSFYSASSQFSTILSIVYRSEVSSAYPDILNLKVTDSERAALKARLVPSWFDGDDTNWRLYDADQTVNLWWNSFFKMPLARGYIDAPIPNSKRGFSFLLDTSLSEEEGVPQLTYVFNYPEETAASYAQFLIDWNAVKYFEGPHVGVVLKPLPKYLEELLVARSERVDFSDEKYTKRPVTLNYMEFKDDVTSPILSGTNAPTIGIFASENGYEIVVRALAERGNLNSQVIIPLKLGRYIDEYGISELKNFDVLYLHDYDYKNQAKTFKTLRGFLEMGKKIYVDTGGEVRESTGILPDDIFPVKKVTRRGLGRVWELENTNKSLGANVDFSQFSPPVFDGDEWNISYSLPEDVKSEANVILKNRDKVIMASLKVGSGELIWGGFNFAYHVIRDHNVEEAKFFNNILSATVKLERNILPESEVNFINPNKRIIKTQGARGILFKEQAYDGWSAKLMSNGQEKQSLKIYKAGPAYPGFMYVVLPDTESAEVKFNFSGSLTNKILIFGSLALVILLFEEVVFSGIILGRIRRFGWLLIRSKVGHWWQKEDE